MYSLEKNGIYVLNEGNRIGQIGEVIATSILEELFPRPEFRIIKSHTYPYYSDPCDHCSLKYPFLSLPDKGSFEVSRLGGADFEVEHNQERILVEVKTTLHKILGISGAKNRRYFKKQMREYKESSSNAKTFLLQISLASFPDIKYRIEEIDSLGNSFKDK